MGDVPQLVVAGLTVGAVYALIALGFTMIYAATGILNFAQGEFAMLGALLGVTLLGEMALPYAVGAVAVMLVVSAVGAVYAQLVLKPLARKRASLDTIIVATIAVALLLHHGAERIWGTGEFVVPAPVAPGSLVVGGVRVNPQSLFVLGLAAVALAAVWVFLNRTTTGKVFRATAANEQAATLLGISPDRVALMVVVLSAALTALAGLLFAPVSFASAYLGLTLGLRGIVAAIAGGLGQPFGAVVGGLLLGVVESLASYRFTGYQDAVVFGLLLVMLVLRPSGLVRGRVAVRMG